MTFVSLSIPRWPTDAARSTELVTRALELAPRVLAEPGRGLLWADARGLDAVDIATRLLSLAQVFLADSLSVGLATTPIGAEVAARQANDAPTRMIVVAAGEDRKFLAPLTIEALAPNLEAWMHPLLTAVGIQTCDDLARLDRESVEVRFGGAIGTQLWRLARADDTRPIFSHRPKDLPHAEIEWTDYELDSQAQVVFIVNSLLGSVVEQLREAGQGAHQMDLEFSLASRLKQRESIRCSHPTADRRTWLRVIRAYLDQVEFDAPIVKIGLSVARQAPVVSRQNDLFDVGASTAKAAEAALAHLLDVAPGALMVAERSNHPLIEERLTWRSEYSIEVTERRDALAPARLPLALTMQLVPKLTTIEVEVAERRGVEIPTGYTLGTRRYRLTLHLGPDRVENGVGIYRVKRDYFQCIRDDGVIVLLSHDLTAGSWSFVGWWD
jgi:hypothetical protein